MIEYSWLLKNELENGFFVDFFQITQTPSSSEVNEMLQNIYEKLSQSQRKIARISNTLAVTPVEPLPEYVEVISNDVDCLRWQSKIQDELERSKCKLREYEEHWTQFAHIWQSDKKAIISEFESQPTATATKYDQKVQDLITLSNQVAVREVSKKVNFMMVDATKLRKTILVEIEEWKRVYLISLKNKTQAKINEFYAYTEENGRNVSVTPKSVDELQKCCAVYERLRSEIDDSKCKMSSLNEQFEVLLKYGVPIDGELCTMKDGMRTQWQDYLKKLNDADEVLNNAKDSFKLTLESTRKTPDFFQ